jgi:superfamily II DNA or RNA helicase
MQLRDYQHELITNVRNALRIENRLVVQLPTGGGKTICFSYIVSKALKNGRNVLVLTDRLELFNQAMSVLDSKSKDLKVMMVETLNRRLKKPEYQDIISNCDLLIIDECHKRTFDKILSRLNSKTIVLGFTATPHRDGTKSPLIDYYKSIVSGVEIPYLVKMGFLSKPKYYGMPVDLSSVGQKGGDYNSSELGKMYKERRIFKGVIDNWEKYTKNTKTLIFSSTIENSKEIVLSFKSRGYDVRHLDSKMNKKEREETLSWFSKTPKAILSNVGILTTGFDEPTIETIILYRATRSLPLYLQMIGRGSRKTEFKNNFSILDFGNNITSFGFWHSKREWSLEGQKPKPLGESILKNCPSCQSFISASATNCKHCGFIFTKLIKEQEIANLNLLDPKELRTIAVNGGLKEMLKLSKAKLVSPYWCLHQIKERCDAEKFIYEMGWKSSWIHVNGNRYGWY